MHYLSGFLSNSINACSLAIGHLSGLPARMAADFSPRRRGKRRDRLSGDVSLNA